jgi:HAD superfamily hydrolase (TIGR01457 family)
VGRLLDLHDAFLFDLDGVLYRGDEPVAGAADTVAAIHDAGRALAFVTNNSARTPERVAERLRAMGIAAEPGEVVTSAMATATLLVDRDVRTAFVIGEEGVRSALAAAGVELLDGDPPRADAVVVGWDRSVDYDKLRTASLLVQRGATLVATNTDASYPAPDGLWPGAGALVAAIVTTTGVAPVVVVKPGLPLFEEALRLVGPVERPLFVGDRVETDVAGGLAAGLDTLLVLSGVSTGADLVRSGLRPTYLARDVSAVLADPAPPSVRPAGPGDVPDVERMLREADLDARDVEARLPLTVVADGGDGIVGSAALESFGRIAHLRSVVVEPSSRGHAVGIALVARALALAAEHGHTDVYAVTETAEPFFTALGFGRIGTVEALPEEVAATPMVREVCSVSAVALHRPLRG